VEFSFPHPIPSLQAVAMKSKRILLISELALIIAGVFVFRSLWMLLDSLVFRQTPPALLVVADRRERSYGLGVTLHRQTRRQVRPRIVEGY
jgi:hypothetical protein